MTSKASKEYWEKSYEDKKSEIAPKGAFIRTWLEDHFPHLNPGESKTCIEIGCYPGRYLAVFGELGYKISGIDYYSQLDLMIEHMKKQGYQLGNFWQQDFFTFDPGKKYDVVMSVGFIEHFPNYEEVIEKHLRLVKDGGTLVLVAPNFIGRFQHWLHSNFDQQNLSRHYVPAMDVKKWVEILRRENFQIIYQGYFGSFHFWTDVEPQNAFSKIVLKILYFLKPYLQRLLPKDKRSYSPFGGVIARKNWK